eukprot:TRINITY_DN16610_c0_g1_i1.p1 TRINITY_DN16610_c0_g1~~TRINITY_DN16610_c0_g1_i1.p1  ORF type:complete len:458 (+),score=106.42 TRINITY_DN16610_c0_g1_i1:101-1375(+)
MVDVLKDPQMSVDMMKISESLRAQCVAGISYSQELKKILDEKLQIEKHACKLLRTLSFPLPPDLKEQVKKISSSNIDMDLVPLFDENESEKIPQKSSLSEEHEILPDIYLSHVSQTFECVVGGENDCIVWNMVLYVQSEIEGITFHSVILSTPELSFETQMKPLGLLHNVSTIYPIHVTTKFSPLKKSYFVDIIVEWSKSVGIEKANKLESYLAFIGRVKLSPELEDIATPHNLITPVLRNAVVLDLVLTNKHPQKEKIDNSIMQTILVGKMGITEEDNERKKQATRKFTNSKQTLCVTLFSENNNNNNLDDMTDMDKIETENAVHIHITGHSIPIITQFISSLNYYLPSHIQILPNPITPSTLTLFSMVIDAIKKEVNYITKTMPKMEKANENVYEEIRQGFLHAQMNTNHIFAHLNSDTNLE